MRVCVLSYSVVFGPLYPMACSPPGSAAHGLIPKQEYWSELPFPPPEDLPYPGIKPGSPALQADSFPLSHWGSPAVKNGYIVNALFFSKGNDYKQF